MSFDEQPDPDPGEMFDHYIEREKKHLLDMLSRLGESRGIVQTRAAELLKLGADIAVARLEGGNTAIAEQSARTAITNLKAVVVLEVADRLVGYIEGVLLRLASSAGAILVSL